MPRVKYAAIRSDTKSVLAHTLFSKVYFHAHVHHQVKDQNIPLVHNSALRLNDFPRN